MFKNKKVIIFDMDGTLIDSIETWNDIDIELINRLGNKKVDNINIGEQRSEILAKYCKADDSYLEYCSFLKDKYNMNAEKEDVKKTRYEIAQNYLEKIIDYKKDAEVVLKKLKEKGYRLVIATATNEETMTIYKYENRNIISKANIEEFFELTLTKNSVEKMKPNPEVHMKIMNKLNVKPEECLIVEDSLVGVQAAKNANIDVITIYDKHSDSDREEIEKISKYNFKDFKEILNYLEKERKGEKL